MRTFIVIGAIVVASTLAYTMLPLGSHDAQEISAVKILDGALASVLLPKTLSQNAQIGKQAFEAKCASCHGTNAAGQDGVAPPLVHIIYEPGHHGDETFQRAAAMGVRAHHWPFGNMPAIEGITQVDIKMVTAYIRELQRANGIY